MNILLTDLYQLTMAYGYYRSGMVNHEAVFHLFFRKNPFQGGYAIAVGLANVIQLVNNFFFTASDIAYLASLSLFDADFLNYLQKLRLTVDIDAIPEGTVVFPQMPLIRVKGNLIQCQLLETLLLNSINFPTLIATKASRICYAAKNKPVLEFGLRRAQGYDGGLTASRAAYIGGCAGTSNVLANRLYDIPLRGTHAHSWVMSFPTEAEAFAAFAQALPEHGYLLVDTFNTLEGVQHAMRIGKKLKGIRLDSGDLAYLSIQARKLLDKSGFKQVIIMGSNDLDEYVISSLNDQKAKIDIWAVGTKLSTAFDQPALEGVYKLGAIRPPNGEWEPKLKISEQNAKISVPGVLRVKRFYTRKHKAVADCIYDELIGLTKPILLLDMLDSTHQKKISDQCESEELLVSVFKKGQCVYQCPAIHDIRQRATEQLTLFHPAIRRFLNPHLYPVGLEQNLFNRRIALIIKAKNLSVDSAL